MKTKRHDLTPSRSLRVPERGGAFGTDALLLSAFAACKAGDRVLELGSGCGIIPLLFCLHRSFSHFYALERREDLARLAEENLEENGFSGRVTVLCRDLREPLPLRDLDAVLANPPYFPLSLPGSPDEKTRDQKSEQNGTLADFCRAASAALRFGGRAFFIFRAERLCDLVCSLRAEGLEPKRLLPVLPRPDGAVKLFLLSALKGGKSGLKLEKPLLLRDENGRDTDEMKEILEKGRMKE